MISRRSLLGTLIGLPFGIKAAKASPILGDVMVTAISGPSPRRIIDIGDAALFYTQTLFYGDGIRLRKEALPSTEEKWDSTAWYSGCVVPEEIVDKGRLAGILSNYVQGGSRGLSQTMQREFDSQCRFVGIQIGKHKDGIVIAVLCTNAKKPRRDDYFPTTLYQSWVQVLS